MKSILDKIKEEVMIYDDKTVLIRRRETIEYLHENTVW